jgi:hypothetical protein
MKRARNRDGSVVLNKRIKKWNFFWWENGKRRSKKIGTVSQCPTKASAWRAAKPLRHSLENQSRVSSNAPTLRTLVEQYRAEKMPKRYSTRRSYDMWLRLYVAATLGRFSNHRSTSPPRRTVVAIAGSHATEPVIHLRTSPHPLGLRHMAR